MSDEPDVFVTLCVSEACKDAVIVAAFYQALTDLRLPDLLIHELTLKFYEDRLENCEVNVDDD